MIRNLTTLLLACLVILPTRAFVLEHDQKVRVLLPDGLAPVAMTAYEMLCEDLRNVFDAEVTRTRSARRADIVCSIDETLPRESFIFDAQEKRLQITAADAHGLAYGLLELSEQAGVSPWEDWADATPTKKLKLTLNTYDPSVQSPKVAYRGIFINDEDWGLNPWATAQEPEAWVVKHDRIKGAVGPKVTERIFRLMLRLRLNYYWPPMHECTQPFFLTPGNREVAARYGIYIGGSHCEPMASSAAAEWGIRGEGEYNYVTNREGVQRFWQERLDSVKNQEILYTLGMRGVHDGAMQGVRTRDEKRQALQQVIDDQRQMLTQTLGRPATEVPQVFVPYKEVLDVYLDGLQVPDDVTLMWTDDNYGYVRHYPDSIEQQRSGGNGLYYHVSYWGRPHDYCWLSTLSPYLMEQQLTEAYHRGIQKIWMLNVGDIKPAEVQIHVFAQLAWEGVNERYPQYQRTSFAMREMLQSCFGNQSLQLAEDAIRCLNEHYRLAWDRKPEHLAGTRVEEKDKAYWNEIRPIDYWTKADVEQRLAAYARLSAEVRRIEKEVLPGHRDAFYQLIAYPILAAEQMNRKFLSPEDCEFAYDRIQQLTERYNEGYDNGGKWNGILSAAPRGLRVFQPVKAEDLPVYPDAPAAYPLLSDSASYDVVLCNLGTKGWALLTPKGKVFEFALPEAVQEASAQSASLQGDGSHLEATHDNGSLRNVIQEDSLHLTVLLLPTMPVDGKKLSFAISLDDGERQIIDFETYDRSEDWKRNVLRNASERKVTLPIGEGHQPKVIRFEALTENVVVEEIVVSKGFF